MYLYNFVLYVVTQFNMAAIVNWPKQNAVTQVIFTATELEFGVVAAEQLP